MHTKNYNPENFSFCIGSKREQQGKGFSVGKYIAVGENGDIAFCFGDALKDLRDDVVERIRDKKKPTKEDLLVLVLDAQGTGITQLEKKLNEPKDKGFSVWRKIFHRRK